MTGLQQCDHGLSIISSVISFNLLASSSSQDFNCSTLTVSPGSALEALHKGRRMRATGRAVGETQQK